ncbi:MAG: methionyl-tRNA formyltransferase [Acidimicrobiaceae bacterium]|nr:methionyl-tRNA formyltransferase [Acidimicrobiaceae bacterium]MCS5673985.1 hypothetical protein [Acidimicrobiales bacterium]MEE2806199.1 methionyl-tRNA formyltransferase [Actinomycetota bacterium]|tara:strand:- start:8052 stop:8939 length:888 start_codon:yes stop_codon:yes gene_type:complete
MRLPAPPEHPRSVVYFGSPAAAVPALIALVDAGFEIPLVISMPDRRRSRRAEPSPTPVKEAALKLGIAVSEEVSDALTVTADCGVVVAYGRLIDTNVLHRLPMINVHFSLLPRWRGAAPVERALLEGDKKTGVCIMGIEPELDAGPVYRWRETDIKPTVTATELREELAILGARELVTALREGLRDPVPQEGEVSVAKKIHRADLQLDWARSAIELDRVVRVGGAWTTTNSAVLKVHEARPVEGTAIPGELDRDLVGTGEGLLRLLVVQPEGKSRLNATAWINGARLGPDAQLGT